MSEAEMIIVDKKGYEYPAPAREKYHRVTKKEIHDFVRWMFKNNLESKSNAAISNMYYSLTGVHINRETVRRNRKCWIVRDGRIVNVENEFGNIMN